MSVAALMPDVAQSPWDDAERDLRSFLRKIAETPRGQQTDVLCRDLRTLRPLIVAGYLDPGYVEGRIYDFALGLKLFEPGSESEIIIGQAVRDVTMLLGPEPEQPPDAGGPEDFGLPRDGEPLQDLPAPPSLKLVCPPAWHDVPLEPMRWLAMHRIPAGDATILSGDGGGGKTTVALQLAVSVERGLGDWLGTTCESGPVIFLSAEEPDHEMRRRLQRVARKRGLNPDEIAGLHFHFASPENCLLAVARADGIMWPTPLFESLAIAAAAIRPALIVVDSIAATFGGNQNDRVHARTFVSLFRRLAQDVDSAVLLLDHPSLSGITSGTGRGGSMDWQNATRARLHLETVQGADGTTGRVLEMKKSNYGPVGDKVTLQWEDGCFVMEGSEAGQAAPYRAAAQQALDDLFLRLLEERNAQGRWVTPNKAAGYAPKELAAMQGAGTVTAIAFAHAMERLLTAKRITVEPFGPPSKQRQRLVAILPTTLPTGN